MLLPTVHCAVLSVGKELGGLSGGEDHRWQSFGSVDCLPETAGSRRVRKGRKSDGSVICFTVALVTVYHEIDRGFLPVPEHLPIGQLGGSGRG